MNGDDTYDGEPGTYFGYVGDDGHLVVLGPYPDGDTSALSRLKVNRAGIVICRAWSLPDGSARFRELLRTDPEWFRREQPAKR